MSMAALRWARGVRGITSAQKAVLLLLADQANDEGECWPSVVGLADDACLSERGARDSLRAIEAAGLMSRIEGGGRHRTTLYRLHVTEPQTRHPLPPKPRMETRQILPETRQQVPERGQMVPERGQHLPPNPQEPSLTLKEPSRARAKPPAVVMALPPWLPPEAWDDWCQHRLRIGRKGWTHAAAVRCVSTLERLRDTGDDPRAVIDQSIAGGWTGLFPLKSRSGAARSSQPDRWSAQREAFEDAGLFVEPLR